MTLTPSAPFSSRTTTYGYDDTQGSTDTHEFVVSITNALNETASQTWDPTLGVVLTATDPNNLMTKFSYDAFGLKTEETDPDSTYVKWCYGPENGNCNQSPAPALPNTAYWVVPTHYSATTQPGATGLTVYDSFGRPLQSTGNLLGGTQTNVETVYDTLGRVLQTSTPYSGSAPSTWTFFTYDSFGRPATVYSPKGADANCTASYGGETACTTVYVYQGLTRSVQDPNGNVTGSAVDAAGEVTSVTDAAQGVTSYDYDPFGDLLTTTDAAQNQTSMIYDSWGRKTNMTDPNMGSWVYHYDPFGELTSQIDANNQTISLNYDALGRLISKTVPGETGSDTWTYDGPGSVPTPPYIGKLYSVQSGDGNYSRAYQYDGPGGRPSEVDATIAGNLYATNTRYDDFGRVSMVTYPNQPTPLSDDPPVAVASVSPSPAVVAQTITLNGSQSYDPDNGPQPLSYTWSQNTGPTTIISTPAPSPNPNFSFSTNVAGTYSFNLMVSDSVLTDSATVSVTVAPAAIIGLTASSVDPNTGDFSLSWQKPVGSGTNYLEQSTNGGAFQQLPGSYANPAPLTGYANGSYKFAVQTCSNGACDAWSSPVSVTVLRTPGMPSTPTLTSPNPSNNGQASLSWLLPSGTITYYKVFKSTDGGAYDSGTSVGNVRAYTVPGLTSPHIYSFKVEACNGAPSCSNPSGAVSVTVDAPGAPWAPTLTGPRTVALGGTAGFSWSNNGGTVTSWTLQRTDTNSGKVTTPYTGTATTFSQVMSLASTFEYVVKACNSYGCSGWSNAVDVVVGNGGNTPVQSPTQSPAPSTGAVVMPATPIDGSWSPVQLLAVAKPDPDTHSRVQDQRNLGLRRLQLEVARAQYQRAHDLTDRSFDVRQPGNTLYAAQVEGEEALAPSASPFRSVQDAVATGRLQPADLSPHKILAGTTSRFSVSYDYDGQENLTKVVNTANTSLIYWQGTATDAFGHITTEILGNGIVTGRTYDLNTGALQEEASGVGQNPAVADRVYTWDADGNLNTRQDNVHGLTETFTYDNLNRLKTAAVSGAASSTLSMGYDAVGNITSKTDPGTGADMGTYAYDPNHPMEISSITPSSGPAIKFQYDNSNGQAGNGNLMNDGTRTYTWDAENRATLITNTATGVSTSFAYTPDGMRYAESTNGSDPTSLTEVNGLFELYTEGGHTSYRNMIAAPTGVVAVYTVRDDSLVTTRYLTTDHLGSSSEITNEVGTVTEAMSYDAFGAKRDPNSWQTYTFGTAPGTTDVTDKGYTGQQQLDALGLVHMNGRVQDPYTGRFVSADPTVPDPFYSQAFNRYAYVYNKPLAMIDPSGFDPDGYYADQDCPQGCLHITIDGYTHYGIGAPPGFDWQYIVGTDDGTSDQNPTGGDSGLGALGINGVEIDISGGGGKSGGSAGGNTNAAISGNNGGFYLGGTHYDKNGNDKNGNPCQCSVPDPSGTRQFQNFDPTSLASTCAGCDIQIGNLSGFVGAGTGTAWRPPLGQAAQQPNNAGGGGPTVGVNRNGSGSVGNTGLGHKLADLTSTVIGDISTGLGAAEQYGQYVANSNPDSVALASKLGKWGNRLGIAGTGLSAALTMNAALNGDGWGATQYGVDSVVGGVALYVGGTVGFAGAATYTAVRATGLGDYLGSVVADLPNYGVSQFSGGH